jgi:integrative and conjugative element protein (TIGR02256 family)
MKLLLPLTIIDRLNREVRCRIREIGGVLVAEHVSGDVFRIVDFSVQHKGGTVAHFVRDPKHHKVFLANFFARTGQNYQRFNYIGEWHTHPAFQPLPSSTDVSAMFDIVDDPEVGVNSAILVIIRFRLFSGLELSATLFRAGISPQSIHVEVEGAPEVRRTIFSWILALTQR